MIEISFEFCILFSTRTNLKENRAQIALKIKNNFRKIPALKFSERTTNLFDGYIFTKMHCVLTFKSLPLSANYKRDKFLCNLKWFGWGSSLKNFAKFLENQEQRMFNLGSFLQKIKNNEPQRNFTGSSKKI